MQKKFRPTYQHDDNWNDDELYLNRRILARMINTQYKTRVSDINAYGYNGVCLEGFSISFSRRGRGTR